MLDLVHDIQTAYRKVLNCMSRPGSIENLACQIEKVDIDVDFSRSNLIMMYMLLDAEVSFKIVSHEEEKISKLVNQLTYGKYTSLEEADFIFIMKDADEDMVEQAFKDAKIGDLIDPHKSATIVVEVEEISGNKELMLTGPGIKKENYMQVKIKGDWLGEREKKNIEYPLGIDMILLDEESNVMCLPRTTQIKK
ncbi:phosphonate C-P lyase system protein PhnH [Clostridium sp. BL-8]|uniref:phosphonate C-P lyase system protein PhnH n=1 Tax=Clostridium sp. BL-8 TaxID=349938 RepID=UPI0009D19ABD|nr:phosphonate C-P lyase system protein PhnH [Clostridium sp. BL-8]OOM78635.1 alpha-D-ribose 1-methylphosphonate 5-triphosphate synthase subunit PhnH [Clostridium sp. BL-8]